MSMPDRNKLSCDQKKKIELMDIKLRLIGDKFARVQNENLHLKHKVAMLTLKIENYGLLLSGNHPERMTPNNLEISKRVGSMTI